MTMEKARGEALPSFDTGRVREIVAAAALSPAERDVVRRLEREVLEDDRTYLELLLHACSAELGELGVNGGVSALLKATLRRGRPLGAAMLARSRFFWTLRQLTSRSLPEIARLWGCRDHTVVKYGADKHAQRVALPASAERTRGQAADLRTST